jgi:hypothetical protein
MCTRITVWCNATETLPAFTITQCIKPDIFHKDSKGGPPSVVLDGIPKMFEAPLPLGSSQKASSWICRQIEENDRFLLGDVNLLGCLASYG